MKTEAEFDAYIDEIMDRLVADATAAYRVVVRKAIYDHEMEKRVNHLMMFGDSRNIRDWPEYVQRWCEEQLP